MEIKWNGWRKGGRSRLICPLMAFALTAGLIMAVPGLSGQARAVDFNKACSLTIAPGGPELDDLAEADVVVDLYKVADAAPVSGYDTYTYNFLSGYEGLKEAYDQKPDNDGWKKMAQTAAKYALESGKPVSEGNAVNSPVKNLGCGLYLLIARGEGIEKYTTTVMTEDGTENIATIANSKTHTYTFAPELISLPSKHVEGADGTPGNTTAGNGDWDYDMAVTLKPEQGSRYGSLEIVKGLETFDESVPAVFVFQVEAVLDGENVYSNVVTMNFTEAGEKKTLIENQIPVGAKVTVTEVYSGASYEITSAEEQNAVIEAADVASVTFTNDHTTTTHGGGGVNNHFYNNGDGWQLEDPEPVNDNNGK